MVYNFRRLSNTSMSIATSIISLIFAALFLFLGLKYDSNVLVGFILLTISCVMFSASSITSFIKCIQFGNDNLKKSEAPEKVENKSTFKLLSNLIAIFSLIAVVLFIVGVIVMLA